MNRKDYSGFFKISDILKLKMKSISLSSAFTLKNLISLFRKLTNFINDF